MGSRSPTTFCCCAGATEWGCERLQQTHEKAGLAINHDTGDSHWAGEAMDYNWALQGLFEREPKAKLAREYC